MKAGLARGTRLLRQALGALPAAPRYMRARPVRAPRPRLGVGPWGLIAWTIGTVCLIGVSMVLIDPLIPSLRPLLSPGVVRVFERITDLGLGGVVLWPLGLAFLVLLGLSPDRAAPERQVMAALAARVGFVILAVAGIGLVVLALKYGLGRARPYMAAQIEGPSPTLSFRWFSTRAGFSSFPSGHSTVVFATACAFSALYPRARVLLLAGALLVGSSRVMLGAHYPSDVVAGGGLAMLSTALLVRVFAARRLVFCVGPDGAVSAMPGPSARRFVGLFMRPPSSLPSAPEEAMS